MNAEQLRETYNRYFSSDTNRWSSTNHREALKVSKATLRWLSSYGFKKSKPALLDVGCGTGFFTNAFQELGVQATGLDYSEVALQKSRNLFNDVPFIQMNGFEPQLSSSYDIIFCRGFSGFNTHDLNFVRGWVNKYIPHLTPGGFFILGFRSDFSGKEKSGETVNHSRAELKALVDQIEADFIGMREFSYFGWISILKRWVYKRVLGKQQKIYFSLFFRKPAG
jgi:SAM-dependent methyltransferase